MSNSNTPNYDISRGTEKGSEANTFGHMDDKIQLWKQMYKYDFRKDNKGSNNDFSPPSNVNVNVTVPMNNHNNKLNKLPFIESKENVTIDSDSLTHQPLPKELNYNANHLRRYNHVNDQYRCVQVIVLHG